MLNQHMAAAAIEAVRPLVEGLAASKTITGTEMHVIVGRREQWNDLTVLAERSYGDKQAWPYNYEAIARGKAEISARTGLPSRLVQHCQPELLNTDDVRYGGSVVVGNIVVAVSGVQSHYDEAISAAIAALARAACHDRASEMSHDETTVYYSES